MGLHPADVIRSLHRRSRDQICRSRAASVANVNGFGTDLLVDDRCGRRSLLMDDRFMDDRCGRRNLLVIDRCGCRNFLTDDRCGSRPRR